MFNIKHKFSFSSKELLVLVLLYLFLSLSVAFNLHDYSNQQFVHLAQSLMAGRIYFTTCPDSSCMDFSFYHNRYYWPLGPVPAFIVMPFVYLFSLSKLVFLQNYLSIFVVSGILLLIIKISRKIKYSREDSYYWAFAFCFASMFLAIAFVPWSWWFSQSVTVFLLFLLIYLYLNDAPFWSLGLITAFLLNTRLTAGFGAAAFIFLLSFVSEKSVRQKARLLSQGFIPVVLGLLLMFSYNFVRFGNFLESGYSYQEVSKESLSTARSYGLFSLAHIPGNLYYALLSTPLPVFRDNVSHVLKFPFIKNNNWGISIFITSPYLLYLFLLKYRERFSLISLATVFITAFLVFLYYGIGASQLGYRYGLDFLPFLFLLLMKNYKEQKGNLSGSFKAIIIMSAFFNLYLFWTMGLWPEY